MLERDLVRKAKEFVHARGGVAFKMHGNVFVEAGIPDVLMCVAGRFVAAEAKVPGKRPTAVQELQMDRIRRAGGVAFWFDSMGDFEAKFLAAVGSG